VIQLKEARAEWRRRHPKNSGDEANAQSSDEVIRQAREKRQQQILDCSWRAAKKILTKLKNARPTETTLAELIAGEFEELTRSRVPLSLHLPGLESACQICG